MESKNYLTKEGYEKLHAEYRHVIDVELPEVLQAVKEARALGDLSENADYSAARKRQGELERRAAELLQQLEESVVEDVSHLKVDKVERGLHVLLLDLSDNTETKYQIVGSTESDPSNNKISFECALAKAIIGHRVGDVVQVKAVRPYEVKILKISND